MSKLPWGNIGAWAAEAERAEEEEQAAAERAASAQPPSSFPSLKEAVTTTAKQKKKTKMSLSEFTMQQSSYSDSSSSRGLTAEEMLRLPTGPKERSADELQHGRLGGGFSSYGPRPGSEGRRSYPFQDDERRGGRGGQARVSEMIQPSRADEVDNWGSMKRNTVPEFNYAQSRPGGKFSSLGGGGGGGGGPGVASRADEVDNWTSAKKPIPQLHQQSRSSSFGSGLSRPDPDRWRRNEQKSALDTQKSEVEPMVKVNKPNPFGAARPREEVLAEKGLDWKKLDLNIDEKQQYVVSGLSRPTSSQSSRPESPLSARSDVLPGAGEGEAKRKPKVNPFGDAKPREVLLEEKGLDWKKIDLDLEHRRVEREETAGEKNLKEEIEQMRKEMLQKSGDDQTSGRELILQKEQELELLTRQLDDKVRYSQKHFERPDKGSSFNERPLSQPGTYEEPRGFNDQHPSIPGAHAEPRVGYLDRPRSRPGRYEDHRAGSMERSPAWGGAYEDPRATFAERPPSHSGTYDNSRPGSRDRPRSRPGAYEEPRGGFPQKSSFMPGGYHEPGPGEYNDRPRSRGNMNSWTRPVDDRRTYQGGGGRVFLGGRDSERSGSRW